MRGREWGGDGYLDDRGILSHGALRRFAHLKIFDVGATEDDVLEDFIASGHGTIGRTIFGTERTH